MLQCLRGGAEAPGVSFRNGISERETELEFAKRRAEVDSPVRAPNNASVAQPEIVRRIKTYSAENGRVYQYQFHGIEQREHDGKASAEYTYYATEDRTTMHAVRVIVMREALKRWSDANGRALTGTEEYAVAKMRLFEGFDEDDEILEGQREFVVDDANVAELLEKLNL